MRVYMCAYAKCLHMHARTHFYYSADKVYSLKVRSQFMKIGSVVFEILKLCKRYIYIYIYINIHIYKYIYVYIYIS